MNENPSGSNDDVVQLAAVQNVHQKIEVVDDFITKSQQELEEMSEEDRFRYEHELMHKKHRGHEAMHLEMMLILIVSLAIAQILLVFWRKHHYRSYQISTLFGMWIIPVVICAMRHWYRFIIIWALFSTINSLISYHAGKSRLNSNTPRIVYKWFLLLHKMSYVLGIAGYFVIMGALLGLNLIFGAKLHEWMDTGMLLLFYGLYYGVLGRDFAEVCTDRMASQIGYYNKEGLPSKNLEADMCSVCGNNIACYADGSSAYADGEGVGPEAVYRLSCGHIFHEFCIRGWCIVGKKQMCPYCKEKVDLKRLITNPWEKPHLFYGQLLDWIRYLVAWQPLIMTMVQGINYLLGLE